MFVMNDWAETLISRHTIIQSPQITISKECARFLMADKPKSNKQFCIIICTRDFWLAYHLQHHQLQFDWNASKVHLWTRWTMHIALSRDAFCLQLNTLLFCMADLRLQLDWPCNTIKDKQVRNWRKKCKQIM